jgi:hypothetical protein
MTEFDPAMVIRGVCNDNERIVNWLSRGSDRIERAKEIRLGPMPIGEKVRHVPRSEDLDKLWGSGSCRL